MSPQYEVSPYDRIPDQTLAFLADLAAVIATKTSIGTPQNASFLKELRREQDRRRSIG